MAGFLCWTVAAPNTGRAESAKTDSAKDIARQAFKEGQARYGRGRSDEAIEFFLAAHRLAPAPLLIFNVAQAFRLKGACIEASQHYRSFLTEEEGAPDLRKLAQKYLDELARDCGNTAPNRMPTPSLPAEKDVVMSKLEENPQPPSATINATVAPRDPSKKPHHWVVVTMLASGGTLTAIAGAVALWSNSAHREWTKEDQALQQAPRSGQHIGEWARRQNENDHRLRTIELMDKVAVGAVVSGGLLLLVGAGFWVKGRFGIQTQGLNSASLTFTTPF